MREIDVVQLFSVKLLDEISLREMNLRCSWWSNK